jgi:hypothetical protein
MAEDRYIDLITGDHVIHKPSGLKCEILSIYQPSREFPSGSARLKFPKGGLFIMGAEVLLPIQLPSEKESG